MDSLTATIKAVIQATGSKTLTTGQAFPYPLSYTHSKSFASGTGADQVNELYDVVRTLAGGANESLDLSGTTLLNPYGTAIAFAGIKWFFFENLSTTKIFTVGNAATPWVGWHGAGTETDIVPPGAFLLHTNPSVGGWPVTAGANDLLKIANDAGASADYRLIIGGDLA